MKPPPEHPPRKGVGTRCPTSPRILIVRLSAIGDVIHGLPVVNALRSHFPEATIAWAAEPPSLELLRGHSAIDELITLPRKWLTRPTRVWRARRTLRAFRPDVAVDVQGLTKSAVAAWLSGAPRRIGFGDGNGREVSRWLNNELVAARSRHVVDIYLDLLRPLGIARPKVGFGIPEDANDRGAASEVVHASGCQEPFCVLNPGAGWASKRWPVERYAEVARHLGETWGLVSLVIWAGEEARAWAKRIVAGASAHARLATPTSLRTLGAVTRRARLYVGSDSGPLHLAVAVDTPSIGLYGPWPAERHGPYGSKHAAVQKLVCPGSTRERRRASPKYMEAIDVASVCEACDRVLRRAASSAA